MRAVTVVDYGIGNLYSVQRALEKCDAQVTFATTSEDILKADRVVLPGVGAFADGMSGLKERNLCAALQAFARSGRPLLGICLGMQMLLSRSSEFGNHPGLGIIEGGVVAIEAIDVNGQPQKIPHIGWTSLHVPNQLQDWQGTILDRMPFEASVYLVHSYTAVPDDPAHRLADCLYGGRLISAAIRAGNVYGCQFHPEKSGNVGLGVLTRFLDLVPM